MIIYISNRHTIMKKNSLSQWQKRKAKIFLKIKRNEMKSVKLDLLREVWGRTSEVEVGDGPADGVAVDAEEREHAAAGEGGAEHADEARAQGVAETLAVEVDVGRQRHHGTRPAPQAGQHHHRRVHPRLQANTVQQSLLTEVTTKLQTQYNSRFSPRLRQNYKHRYNSRFSPRLRQNYKHSTTVASHRGYDKTTNTVQQSLLTEVTTKLQTQYNSRFSPRLRQNYKHRYNSRFSPRLRQNYKHRYNSRFSRRLWQNYKHRYNSRFSPRLRQTQVQQSLLTEVTTKLQTQVQQSLLTEVMTKLQTQVQQSLLTEVTTNTGTTVASHWGYNKTTNTGTTVASHRGYDKTTNTGTTVASHQGYDKTTNTGTTVVSHRGYDKTTNTGTTVASHRCYDKTTNTEGRKEMFYLTTHSTYFIYGYMALDSEIARKETRCRHMGYTFWLAVRVLLCASSHRQDNTYHSLCYTSCAALAGMRNSSMVNPMTHCIMSEWSYHRAVSRSLLKEVRTKTTCMITYHRINTGIGRGGTLKLDCLILSFIDFQMCKHDLIINTCSFSLSLTHTPTKKPTHTIKTTPTHQLLASSNDYDQICLSSFGNLFSLFKVWNMFSMWNIKINIQETVSLFN